MTKEQFISLLRSPATINLNMVSGLEEITEQFPYFTNAHLLLTRQYHGHENIKYESYLKKASAYSPDRSILFRLIHTATDQVIHIEKSESPKQIIAEVEMVVPEIELERDNESTEITSESKDSETIANVTSDSTEELTEIEEATTTSPVYFIPTAPKAPEEKAEKISASTEVKLTPQQIIEQRLSEISIPNPAKEENKIEEEIIVELPKTERFSEPIPSIDIAEKSIAKEELPKPDSAKEEKKTVIKLEKAEVTLRPIEEDKNKAATEIPPVSPSKPKEVKVKTEESHSFLEWLQLKSVPVIPIARMNESLFTEEYEGSDKEAGTSGQGDDIIDKFIQSEPRIVPSRSEFYSPGNMARNSIVEHDDLVSETLAAIYAKQGNPRKAIETYQKLILKFPEKSSYFAARIRELEEGE